MVASNIKENDHRLITAIHDNTRTMFLLRFLTHTDHDKATPAPIDS